MAWLPLGPDFTFQPNDASFLRLSRRNEYGTQAMVNAIAVDQTNPQTIYVLQNPWTAGSAGFRTDNGGGSWTPIIDDLTPGMWTGWAATAIAINPSDTAIVYLGTSIGTFYTSQNKGAPGSWTLTGSIASRAAISRIIIDPATAGSATPTLYAGCADDVYVSIDGGASWAGTGAGGQTDSLVVDFSGATPNFYAGIDSVGLLWSNDPTAGWTNLNLQGIGLPASGFEGVLVDFCVKNPRQVYAWFAQPYLTVGLFSSSAVAAKWTQVVAGNTPSPGQRLATFVFAVCPNSPGNGTSDILLFGGLSVSRLTDQTGAGTWGDASNVYLHADQRAFAFAPQTGSTFPAVYVGCDGGLGMSTQLANPASSITVPATAFDELASYADSPVFENLNHGMHASALLAYNGNTQMPAIGYIACGDTGIAGSTGTLGWRAIANDDANAIVASPGPNGVTVWGDNGFYYEGWPNYRIKIFNDTGAYNPTPTDASTGTFAQFSGGNVQSASYNFALDPNGLALARVTGRQSAPGTLQTAVPMPGTYTVNVSSMQYITDNAIIVIDPGTGAEDIVQVTATTATGFTATFAFPHSLHAPIDYQPTFAARIDQAGNVTQLSQDFQNLIIGDIASSPANPNILVCSGMDGLLQNGAVFVTTSASTANASTVWTEASVNVPFAPGDNDPLGGVAIDAAGDVYVMVELRDPTPLYQIVGDTWTPISTTLPPSDGYAFGPLVADPIAPGVLYAAINNAVYVVTIANGTATWQSITANLPGLQVYSLWIGNIGTPSEPLIVLRAGVAARGVYELNVTPGATPPALALYMRAHLMDLNWFPTVIDGVANPYDPTELLYHYQSADIKVDPQQEVSGQTFFTTDPENPLPISHVAFNQLSENASNLPQQDLANVHVQVNNASTTASGDVWVWAIFCQGAAGVASLAASASQNNAFPFWSQFLADGTIAPALPADSPWTSVGAPVKVSAIDAASPQIASFSWTIPTAQFGDHHCLVAFANSAAAPLSGLQNYDVDQLVVVNRQISQKNLTLGPPLPPGPSPGGPRRKLPIIFNNPHGIERIVNLRFDLRTLAPHFRARIGVGDVSFTKPVAESLHELERAEPIAGDAEFVRHAFTTAGGRSATIEGVAIPPFGSHVAEIAVENGAELEPGSTHRFHVQQIVDGKVVGGIVVVVPVEGRLRRKRFTVLPEGDPGSGSPRRQFAPWVRRSIVERAKLLRRPVPF
jgi:hypothetical protein